MNTHISSSDFEPSTLLDLLRWRTNQQPQQRIYSFLADGESEKESFSHAQLDLQARVVATSLQEYTTRGERALLIYPSGLDFIAAFYGCLYSGIIAVPVYPPSATRSDRTLARFRTIAHDVQPKCILTTSSLASRVEGLLEMASELRDVRVIVTDGLPVAMGEQWHDPNIHGDDLAFFQYTSGSTGAPKGVMVTHSNLMHNSSLIVRYCQHPEDAHIVTWLPLYHDLGLIGGILQPLYAGCASTIMSPASFLQRPIRWLQAVSKYKATLSGGPNFAYDLCVRKITEEQKATLDLSHWSYAANGAEPVRAETLERFAEAFASCGFQREAFGPCYGMAEATLVIAAGLQRQFPGIYPFQAKGLEQNLALPATDESKEQRLLVSCGYSFEDQRAIIVDPESRLVCAANKVGEIWVSGPSVAQGYWNKPVETDQTFQAYLSDSGEGPFLRTGDLGFVHNGQFFITGRLKDMIIIRGTNHYPQDIEQTVDTCHPALKVGGAAFSVEAEGEERLVIVQEVERQYLRSNLAEVVQSIRKAVAENHELQTYAVVLLKTGTILKTSSGKVQRRGNKQAFLNGDLEKVFEWRMELDEPAPVSSPVDAQVSEPQVERPTSTAPDARTIQEWLVARVAAALKISARELDVHAPLASYGMDSAHAVSLAGDLEEWLNRELPPTLLYDYPNIHTLACYLAGEYIGDEDEAQAESPRRLQDEAIAIVGLGCRFPGADNPDLFWQRLIEGYDGISEVPSERWNLQDVYATEQAVPGKMNTRWGGFIEQIDQFDPYFFGISPREAERMDPQQRLLLEVTWEALENAGQVPQKLVGSQTGVFVGISSNDYSKLQGSDLSFLDAYSGTGNAHSIAANRLSYLFDLRGPSMALDTACSSSLVAIHQACLSLRMGECDQAIAGGVNIILSPDLTVTFSQARMMSSEGRCKTFDDSADGYVRSEGCGVVILKPLSAALQAGDRVLAVIRGSAVNQDGRSNGLTAPNGPAQEAVIRQALRNANVSPEQISYVETHGSSTPLGDPIEFGALKSVLMAQRSTELPCILGAVKSNIGHLEAAAGIAGFIKTVLSLHHGEIAPNVHFKKLNQHISLNGTTFVIPTKQQAWPAAPRRLAGVSAFGFGGTNAHIVLEAAPEVPQAINEAERPLHVLALSARSDKALQQLAARYKALLDQETALPLADICFTASSGRTHFDRRLAIVADSPVQLHARLTDFVAGAAEAAVITGNVQGRERSKVAFLFTGQGSQYSGMARQLYETEPVFKDALDQCEQILRPYLDQPLLSVIYPAAGDASLLHETAYTQPALFAVEYALAQLWNSWDVEPDIVMGHSVGEYVAACVAGILTLEDGLKLIAERARLMQALPERGEMMVIFAEPERVAAALAPYQAQVSIAVINGPQNTVISGTSAAVQEVARRLDAEGVATHAMVVSHAFHSPLMEPMLAAFEQAARHVHFAPARIPLVCNVTGQIVSAGETLDAGYWSEQIRSTVQFAASMQTLAEQGYKLFVELGPHAVLSGMGRRCLPDETISWLPSLHKDRSNWSVILQSVATLYTKGVEVDWCGFDQAYARRRLALPTYPFERERCWFDETRETSKTANHQTVIQNGASPWTSEARQYHPLLAGHVELVHPTATHVWEVDLDAQRLPYLHDHRIQGALALPVSVYVEMAQAASVEAFGPGSHVLTELQLKKLLLLPERGGQKVQVVLASDASEQASFHVYSHSAGMPEQPRNLWTLHASGKIRLN